MMRVSLGQVEPNFDFEQEDLAHAIEKFMEGGEPEVAGYELICSAFYTIDREIQIRFYTSLVMRLGSSIVDDTGKILLRPFYLECLARIVGRVAEFIDWDFNVESCDITVYLSLIIDNFEGHWARLAVSVLGIVCEKIGSFNPDWSTYISVLAVNASENLMPIFMALLKLDELPYETWMVMFGYAQQKLNSHVADEISGALEFMSRSMERCMPCDIKATAESACAVLGTGDPHLLKTAVSVLRRLGVFDMSAVRRVISVLSDASDEFQNNKILVKLFAELVVYLMLKPVDPADVDFLASFFFQYVECSVYDTRMCAIVAILYIAPNPPFNVRLCRVLLDNITIDVLTKRIAQVLIQWFDTSLTDEQNGEYLNELECFKVVLQDLSVTSETAEMRILDGYLDVIWK